MVALDALFYYCYAEFLPKPVKGTDEMKVMNHSMGKK